MKATVLGKIYEPRCRNKRSPGRSSFSKFHEVELTNAMHFKVSNPNELFPDNNYFPIIVDGDTGYGNDLNAKRTVASYARLGAAGIMIEDQLQPKRCGHAKGKSVVSFVEAVSRVKAASNARRDLGKDIVLIARTDARGTHNLEEAIRRARAFVEVGADVTFVEAPTSLDELKEIGGDEKSGKYKMANMLLYGKTPLLPSKELQQMGFALAAYPFDVITASIAAMTRALEELHHGERRSYTKSQVDALWNVAGFPRYYEQEERYKSFIK